MVFIKMYLLTNYLSVYITVIFFTEKNNSYINVTDCFFFYT